MVAYLLAAWILKTAALFVVFTVQGAMWRTAENLNRNGWVIALLWAVATGTAWGALHRWHHLLFPE
jgi:hypothetical protein